MEMRASLVVTLALFASASVFAVACHTTTQDGGAAGNGADPAATTTGTGASHTPPPVPSDDGGETLPTNPTGVADASTSCAAQAAPGSMDAINVTTLTTEITVPMCIYKGSVLLIVNTASMCGFTPEYGPLETIYTKYGPQGFYVLGFPSQTFNQEYGDASDVSAFCTSQYGVTFPMFQIANVNAPNEQPLYTWLKAQPNGQLNGSPDIEWNFAKFLISKTGQVVQRFDHATYPDDPSVTSAIEAELAK
jgi:glutathione peroxidase